MHLHLPQPPVALADALGDRECAVGGQEPERVRGAAVWSRGTKHRLTVGLDKGGYIITCIFRDMKTVQGSMATGEKPIGTLADQEQLPLIIVFAAYRMAGQRADDLGALLDGRQDSLWALVEERVRDPGVPLVGEALELELGQGRRVAQ